MKLPRTTVLSEGNLKANSVFPRRWGSWLGLLTGTQPPASEAASLYHVGLASIMSLTHTVPGIWDAWNMVGAKNTPMKKLPMWRLRSNVTTRSMVGLDHDCSVVFKEGYILRIFT